MPPCSRYDVVAVPFPYTDRPVRQRRPALVVSGNEVTEKHGLVWVMMITSAENRRWADDIAIDDIGRAGLPIPSVIRPAKIATVETRDVEVRGRITARTARSVLKVLNRYLA